MFGYTGKIAFVDLSRETWRQGDTADYAEWVGGRGINHILAHENHEPDTHPLEPASWVALGAGPLVGTPVPAGCRLTVEFKNLLTGGIGSGNSGGHFAPEMKYAGFDHLVITGRASRPTYLLLTDGQVLFRDASDLWGKDTWETETGIQAKENNGRIRTLCIGPAGENQVAFACLISDRGRAAAYGGAGAIWGSKNLKAVAAQGNYPVRLAHPDELMEAVRRYYREVIPSSEFCRIYRAGGTLAGYQKAGENRPHAVRNMSDEFWAQQEIDKVAGKIFDERLLQKRSCFNCPLHGTGIYQAGKSRCEGVQANSWRAFATNVVVTDPEAVLELHSLANLSGMDGDHTSAVLAWAVECFEAGIIDTSDTDGLELAWGRPEPLRVLMERIVKREGFGDVLARGLKAATEVVGRGSHRLALLSRGNALMESGMRSHRAWGMGILTSTRGGSHLRGAPSVEYIGFDPNACRDIYQIEDLPGPTEYAKKAAMVVWYERYKAVIDIMGLCYLPSMWMDPTLFIPEDVARFYRLATGRDDDVEELMTVGERIQASETVFNLIYAGFGRRESLPPSKLVTQAVSKGLFKGEKIDLESYARALDEYYATRGWDPVTGWPTKRTLENLGMEGYIGAVEKCGLRLPE